MMIQQDLITEVNSTSPEVKHELDTFPTQMKRTTAIGIYVFWGCSIGSLLFTIYLCLSQYISTPNHFRSSGIDEFFNMLIFFLPLSFIFGSIPAVISGLLIEASRTTEYFYLHAFSIGFIVTLLLYLLIEPFIAIPLAFVGGFAATISRYIINRIELKNDNKTEFKEAEH